MKNWFSVLAVNKTIHQTIDQINENQLKDSQTGKEEQPTLIKIIVYWYIICGFATIQFLKKSKSNQDLSRKEVFFIVVDAVTAFSREVLVITQQLTSTFVSKDVLLSGILMIYIEQIFCILFCVYQSFKLSLKYKYKHSSNKTWYYQMINYLNPLLVNTGTNLVLVDGLLENTDLNENQKLELLEINKSNGHQMVFEVFAFDQFPHFAIQFINEYQQAEEYDSMFILSTILGIFDVLGTLKEINRTIYDYKDYFQGTEIQKKMKKDQLENKVITESSESLNKDNADRQKFGFIKPSFQV